MRVYKHVGPITLDYVTSSVALDAAQQIDLEFQPVELFGLVKPARGDGRHHLRRFLSIQSIASSSTSTCRRVERLAITPL